MEPSFSEIIYQYLYGSMVSCPCVLLNIKTWVFLLVLVGHDIPTTLSGRKGVL